MSTKREELMTDFHLNLVNKNAIKREYEAARAKDAELIAFIMKKWKEELDGDGYNTSKCFAEAMNAAELAGFKMKASGSGYPHDAFSTAEDPYPGGPITR